MNGFRSIPGLALLASALAVPLAAQGPEEHGGHGERLGHVRFATSCRGAARREVEHGVAYLHSLWYEKATETFTAAAVVDSSCAMAFWGQAMSLLHPLWTPPSSADAKAALAAIDRGVAAARTARAPSTCRHTSSRGSGPGTTRSRRTLARRRPRAPTKSSEGSPPCGTSGPTPSIT